MIMRHAVLALVMLALGAPAAAEGAPQPTKEKKEKKVCRRTVDTGSIMPTKVCRTVTEWSKADAARARQTERDSQAMRNRTPTGGLNPGGNAN
jgi:hypothetical protein